MEPVLIVLVAALVGGPVVAAAIRWIPRRRRNGVEVETPNEPLGIYAINMAHIRVDGVGGLGLVAMAFGIAWAIPRIGESIAFGFLLGVLLASAWIIRARSLGPMPSAGQRPGAHSLLVPDDTRPGGDRTPISGAHELVAAPATS